jgi:hypothetical protein
MPSKKKKSEKEKSYLKVKDEGPPYRILNTKTGEYAYLGRGLPYNEAMRLAKGLKNSEDCTLEEVTR